MTENLCIACARPCPDGYACSGCAYRARQQLAEIIDFTPASRDIAHGFTHNGPGFAGTAGPRIQLNLAVVARLDAVQNTLGTWVRHITAERGGRARTVGSDPIIHAAWYLQAQLEWMRHRSEVDEFLTDVEACARVVRGIARGPGEQKFLGPCGSVLAATAIPCPGECRCRPEASTAILGGCAGCFCLTGCHASVETGAEGELCDGDVYAYRGAKTGRCKACGATVDTGERQAWLDCEVRQHAFRASEIANAYGVKVNTIRSWHARGQLANHGTDADGRPLFNVGDVLDLAAADAARRETERARRERRKVTTKEDAA